MLRWPAKFIRSRPTARFYADEARDPVLTDDQKAWFSQIQHILPWCQGLGVDVGSGGRTLHAGIVRIDDRLSVRPDVVADGCRLPFRDQTFDFVMSVHSVEHMDDTKMALLEWIRVCKVCVCTVGPDIRVHGPVGAPCSDPEHKYMYTGEEFFALVSSLSNVQIVKSYSEIDRYPDYVCVFKKEVSNLLSTGGNR